MRGVPNNAVTCSFCSSDRGAPKDGLCAKCRGKFRKFALKRPFTPDQDAYLRRIYSEHAHNRADLHEALVAYAKRIGYPRQALTTHARKLGITVPGHSRLWTESEIELLTQYAGVKSTSTIAKILGRHRFSVACRMRRMQMSLRVTEGYSRKDIGEVLGVAVETVNRWIVRRYLHLDLDCGRASDREMMRFLREHSEEYDLRRVDQAWFKGMLFPKFGSRVTERRAPSPEIEDREWEDRATA